MALDWGWLAVGGVALAGLGWGLGQARKRGQEESKRQAAEQSNEALAKQLKAAVDCDPVDPADFADRVRKRF